MRILVVSTSLNASSKSRHMARLAHAHLDAQGADPGWIDLQDHRLPFCAGSATAKKDEVALSLRERIEEADGVVLAAPIYNYDVNAAAKNFVELTGRAWTHKVVGFLLAAGGKASYMSVMSLANSLMLDFRCIIIPRFAYATKHAFTAGKLHDDEISERVREVASETLRVTAALTGG